MINRKLWNFLILVIPIIIMFIIDISFIIKDEMLIAYTLSAIITIVILVISFMDKEWKTEPIKYGPYFIFIIFISPLINLVATIIIILVFLIEKIKSEMKLRNIKFIKD